MSSGSLLRGHLRPSGARGPPFLVIGLVLVVVILGFNYWNLNSEYQAIAKEIAELQDNLHMAELKKVKAERQHEMYEKRIRETEGKLGQEKAEAEEKDRQLDQTSSKLKFKSEEIQKLQEEIGNCQQSNVAKMETTSRQLNELQEKYKSLEGEKELLTNENEKMKTYIRDLKLKMEELAFQQARSGIVHAGSYPTLREMPTNGPNIHDSLTNVKITDDRNQVKENITKQHLSNNTNNGDDDQQPQHRPFEENASVEEDQAVPGEKPAIPDKNSENMVDEKDEIKPDLLIAEKNETYMKQFQSEVANINDAANADARENNEISGQANGQNRIAPNQVEVVNDPDKVAAKEEDEEDRQEPVGNLQKPQAAEEMVGNAERVEVEEQQPHDKPSSQPVQEGNLNNLGKLENPVLFQPHDDNSINVAMQPAIPTEGSNDNQPKVPFGNNIPRPLAER